LTVQVAQGSTRRPRTRSRPRSWPGRATACGRPGSIPRPRPGSGGRWSWPWTPAGSTSSTRTPPGHRPPRHPNHQRRNQDRRPTLCL